MCRDPLHDELFNTNITQLAGQAMNFVDEERAARSG
jgi:hypothetical protein